MPSRLRLALPFAALAACGARPTTASEPTASPPTTSTVAPSAPTRPLVLAGEDGLVELGVNGSAARVIDARPALFARWLPEGDLVVLDAGGRDVRRVALDGTVTPVAELPASMALCASTEHAAGALPVGESMAPGGALHAEADDDVWIAEGTLCLVYRDRNVEMMDYEVRFAVRLASGEVTASIVYPDACAAEPPEGCSDATRPARSVSPPPSGSFAFDVDANGRIVGEAGAVAAFPEDWAVHAERRSPSGRWILVSGAAESGDYTWRSLWLVDRSTGETFALAEGRWPAPIDPSEADPSATLAIPGEATVEWLDGEHLLVDRLLVRPGARAVALEGFLAR